MGIYSLATKYISRGGGIIKFSLPESSEYLSDLWWDGEPVKIEKQPTALYHYSGIPPLAVSTGALVRLFNYDVVRLICELESNIQIVSFLVIGKSNARYEYYGIKTLDHLDILDYNLSKFGTDGSIKTLSLKFDLPPNRHLFRIKGIEDNLFITAELAERLEKINDGSLEIREIIPGN